MSTCLYKSEGEPHALQTESENWKFHNMKWNH